MIIKGRPVRDFSLKLNTLFRGVGCLLLLLLLINLYKVSDTLSDSAAALQQLSLPASPAHGALTRSQASLQAPSEEIEPSPEASVPAVSIDDEISQLRQAALVRFASKFNYPNSVEFFSLSSTENWMFSPSKVRERDNVLHLTSCGYYTAKNAMGLARQRVPFIVELVYDFMNQQYSLSGYFKDDRSHYYQFEASKKPVELARNRFQNKWDLACKELNIGKYDDILSVASVGRFVPDAEMTFKRQLNAFDGAVQREILSCIEDEVLSTSVPEVAERQNLCLLDAQCSISDGVADSKCELVNKACSGADKSQLCKARVEEPVAG